MKYYYAAFVPEETGGYSVLFPDVPQAVSQGDTPEECMTMAADALNMALQALAAERRPIAEPSGLEQARAKLAADFAEDRLDVPDGTLFQLVGAPSLDAVKVRVNITLPKGVLDMLDGKAAAWSLSRSGLIAQAVQAYGR